MDAFSRTYPDIRLVVGPAGGQRYGDADGYRRPPAKRAVVKSPQITPGLGRRHGMLYDA